MRHEYVDIEPARPEGNSENSGLGNPRRKGGSVTHQPASKPRLAPVVASAIRPTGEYYILISFPSSRGGPCLLDAQDVNRRLLGQVLELATPGRATPFHISPVREKCAATLCLLLSTTWCSSQGLRCQKALACNCTSCIVIRLSLLTIAGNPAHSGRLRKE